MTTAILLAAVALAAGLLGSSDAPSSAFEFRTKSIDGEEMPLSKFRGKVLVIVNVASKCGLTPQYEGLEALYQAHKEQGLVVIGFPANNFGGQEPGTEEEIKAFCSTKYKVTFPMTSKVSVKGPDIDPLFRWLIAASDRPNEDIEWNFAKFLVGRDGKLIRRFSPRVAPGSEEFKSAVSLALKNP